MNKRIYYLLMVMLFATFGMTAHAQSLTIGEVEAGPGPVSVPVYMEDFEGVEGFQIAFSFDPQILTGFDGIENRFATGSNIIWAPQYNAEEGVVVVSFMDFGFASYDIDEKIFDLKFKYAGGHDVDIDFDLDNTDIMVGGDIVDNEAIAFNSGAVTADPDLVAGTVSMETVTGVSPDQEVLMPIHMEGDGFTNIEVIDLVVGFEPGQLIYEEVILNEELDFDVVTTELQGDGELRIMLTSSDGQDLSDAHIADIRFTYTAVTEAAVTFKPGGEIASPGGPLAFDTEDGVFVPDEFDVTLNIPDLFEYSTDAVDVPVEIHGEFPANAGSVSLRIEYDNSIMEYAGYESDYADTWSIGGTDPLILELVIFDDEGIELEDGTDLITLRFDFLDVGTSEIDIRDGSSIQTPLGVTMPFTPNGGSAGIAVSPIVYDALLHARENTFLEVMNPESNSIETETTYPEEFIEFIEEGGFTVPALTDDWLVDAQFMSEEPMVAGTELHVTYGDMEFLYIVEEEIPAAEPIFLSDLILSVYPDADVRTVLLDHAGLVENWNVDIRSPITYETTLYFAVVTDDDDFTNVEGADAWWKGFMLDEEVLEMTVYGDPQLLFAFNGVPVDTGFEEEFCANQEVEVTLYEVIVGEEPLTIVYTVNGEEYTAEGVSEGDVIFPTEDHEALVAGTYDIVVTSIVDDAGIDVREPEEVYYGTVVINPEPAALFAFNGEVAETGSHFEFCFDAEVEVTLEELLEGEGPVMFTYVLNDDDPVTVEDVAEGDVLFGPDQLPVGEHTLKLTEFVDANGCHVDNVEDIYNLTITVNPEPAVLFAFNGEVAETGSHFEFCFDAEVEVTLEEILAGEGPVMFTYVLNDDDPVTVEDVAEGDVLFGPDQLPVGEHTLKLTELVDANGCGAHDVEEIYNLTITVNPEPSVLFAFNGEVAETGSHFELCFDAEVEVTLEEILTGEGPVMFTYVLNDDDPVTVEDVAEGDVLFGPDQLPVGEHTLKLTELVDANGCGAHDVEEIYNLTITVNPEPAVLFAFNGEVAETGSHFELCFDTEVEVTLEEILTGEGPVMFTYVLNDDDPVTVEDVAEGDVLFGPDQLPVGEHTLKLTELVDANGCGAHDVEEIYNLTITVNPEPAVLFAFNDYIVETGSHLEFAPTEEVTVTLDQIIQGHGPIELTYVLNEDDPVTVEGINEGDVLFEDVLPEGNHTLKLTSLIDANGCAVVDPEEIYHLTIEVFELFEVTFLVDIGPAIEYYDQREGFADFDPEEHSILITGSLLGWADPGTDPDQIMEVTDDPNIYRAVFHLSAGSYEYKYFSDVIGEAWEGGEWDGDPNREVVVEEDMTVENIFGWPDDPVSTEPTPESITLSLYPNPASSHLTIEANGTIEEIRMIDMLGKVVYSSTVQERRYEMNVSDRKNGIYFIQVLTESGIITERVQVTR